MMTKKTCHAGLANKKKIRYAKVGYDFGHA